MIEILQLWSMVTYRQIHLLILFFLLFVVTSAVLIRWKSRKYSVYTGSARAVSVVVPVYREDPKIFDACLKSITEQAPAQLLIVVDGADNEIETIARNYGAEVISSVERRGKRRALAEGWSRATNDIIVQMDSDIVLDKGCLKEITKPFQDEKVVGVSTRHTSLKNGSKLAYILSYLIEESRQVNDRALDGGLIVVDGRCSAWRKEFLLTVRDDFVNERWMGNKCEIGDDRFLSREAIKRGFRTVFQSTAHIYTPAPKSFWEFVRQQIRWRRSGSKFWLLDLVEGVRPTKTYAFKCALYYSSPFVFLAVIVLDMLFFKLPFIFWSVWWTPLIVVIGCSLVTLTRQMIYFGRPLGRWYIPLQGVLGLSVMWPVSIYGTLTLNNQHQWITRNGPASSQDPPQKGWTNWLRRNLQWFGLSIVVFVAVFWSIYAAVYASEFELGE